MQQGSPATKAPRCPKEPAPDDCCQQGCKVCVWDIYRNKLQAYVDYMQQHYPGEPVPDVSSVAARQQQAMMQAGMDAFEQLERRLQQQQQQRQLQER